MIWTTFCAAHGVRLSYNEKKYFYGLECSYYGKEDLRGFEIVYNHKYVFPDAGVTPEELSIEFSKCTKKFHQMVVERSGIVRRLIHGEKLSIRTDGFMKKQLLDMLDVFLKRYPTVKIATTFNKIRSTMTGFPQSKDDLTGLRNFVIRLSTEIAQ